MNMHSLTVQATYADLRNDTNIRDERNKHKKAKNYSHLQIAGMVRILRFLRRQANDRCNKK